MKNRLTCKGADHLEVAQSLLKQMKAARREIVADGVRSVSGWDAAIAYLESFIKANQQNVTLLDNLVPPVA